MQVHAPKFNGWWRVTARLPVVFPHPRGIAYLHRAADSFSINRTSYILVADQLQDSSQSERL